MRRWIAWTAGAIAFVLILFPAGFAIHAWQVMDSPFMQALKKRSSDYSCIGAVHDPSRPGARPERWVAWHSVFDGKNMTIPPLVWRFRELMADWAIDLATDRTEANRMYAALPYGRFDGFNAVAREYAGTDYCALDPRRRQAVLDLYAVGARANIEAALRNGPGA